MIAWCVKHSNGTLNFLSIAKEPDQAVQKHLNRRGLLEGLTEFKKSGATVVRVDVIEIPQVETFKCKMCRDKGWIAGPGDSHPCPNCAKLNVPLKGVGNDNIR